MQEDEIVFEDLHGVQDDEKASEVDLSDDSGVQLAPFDELGNEEEAEETATPDAAGEDQGAGEEDKKPEAESPKSKNKFEARLERERRAKKAAQAEAAAAKQELEDLRKQRSESQKALSAAELSRLETTIESTKTQLSAAIEEGDTGKQIELNMELAEAIASRKAAQIAAEADEEDVSATPPPKAEDKSLVSEWTERHSDWFGKPGYEKETRMARRLDREIYSEGYEPTEDDYFEELDRRIREKAPQLFEMDEEDGNVEDSEDNATDDNPRKERRSSVAPVASESSNERGQTKQNPNRVLIDANDKRVMRNFGLDPTNPKHVKEFALNKRQVQRGEA